MKVKEAIVVLKMFSLDTEVELVFPDAMESKCVTPKKPLTEGEMAALPMRPREDMEYASFSY